MPISGVGKNHLEEREKEEIHLRNKWISHEPREMISGAVKLRSVSTWEKGNPEGGTIWGRCLRPYGLWYPYRARCACSISYSLVKLTEYITLLRSCARCWGSEAGEMWSVPMWNWLSRGYIISLGLRHVLKSNFQQEVLFFLLIHLFNKHFLNVYFVFDIRKGTRVKNRPCAIFKALYSAGTWGDS